MKVCFVLLFLSTVCPLHAQEQVCLGQMELAGMPTSSLPQLGDSLHLHPETLQLMRADGTPVGFVPAIYHPQIRNMVKHQVRLRFDVVRLHPHPAPRQFLRVELWARPTSSGDLEYLVDRSQESEPQSEDS